MNWDDAKILLAIGRSGGLSRTAKLLGLGVSTVHRRAAELERSLDRVLFTRGSDGYGLTEEGWAFFKLAEQAEEHLTAMERHDLPAREVLLRVALPELLGQQILLPDLAAFQAECDGLRLEISTTAVPIELTRQEADVLLRVVRPETGRYRVKRVGHARFGMFASKAYLEQAGPVDKGTLAQHRLIGWHGALHYIVLAQWFYDLAGARPQLGYDSLQAQLLAAQAGQGIAVLPMFAGMRAGLVPVVTEHILTQDLWLMRHMDTQDGGLAEQLADRIHAMIAAQSDL